MVIMTYRHCLYNLETERMKVYKMSWLSMQMLRNHSYSVCVLAHSGIREIPFLDK